MTVLEKVEVGHVGVDYDIDAPEHVGEELAALEVYELSGGLDGRLRRRSGSECGGRGIFIVGWGVGYGGG